MDFLTDWLTDWLKELLIGGIMGNLEGLFDTVNAQVGEIAVQVGTTPAAWHAGVFSLIRQLSETVILPIAGLVLTFVATYELIQMLLEKNNMHEFDVANIYKWVFKHIHNHIYYNSTSLDCTRKYRDFWRSARALRRLSDRVCLENDLSVIQHPKLHSKGRFLHYGQWIGERPPSAQQRIRLAIVAALEQKPADFAAFLQLMEESGFAVKHGRGGVISFLAPGQDKPTRLRSSTLENGFDLSDIQAVIAGERPIPELPDEAPAPARRVNLIIDIQQRMAQGKGPAYERWAKVYNLKQMAAALQYLREHNLMDYETMAASTEEAVDRFHKLAGELRETEAALSKTAGLMAATVDYAKTRPVFDGYKAAKYSKKYLAEHEAELATYRAARATMNELLNGEKLPKIAALKKSRQELAGKKKALYAEYRKAQADMRQAVAVKANIDHLLGHTDGRENKAPER